MTEHEWLTATDPTSMLGFPCDRATERKLQLFACACCRRVWSQMADNRSRRAVEAAEELADGNLTPSDWGHAEAEAWYAMQEGGEGLLEAEDATAHLPFQYAAGAAFTAIQNQFSAEDASSVAQDAAMSSPHPDQEVRPQAELLRDIFGNPFRPVMLAPVWLTSTVVALAEGIYDEKAFDRMPILADALQDAGCDNDDVLSHCRSNGPHVRGCWVVDLVLGKE